jgi:hypothetical protein
MISFYTQHYVCSVNKLENIRLCHDGVTVRKRTTVLACRDATATTLLVLMTIELVKPRKTTAIRKSPALTMQDVS